MKRAASEMDPPVGSETLGDAARRARLDDGSNAAVELAIDSDDDATLGSDDLEDEIDTDAGAEEDSNRAGVRKDGSDSKDLAAGVIPQEALIRRRLGRMKELNALYEDQYWRLLEDLRRGTTASRFATATAAARRTPRRRPRRARRRARRSSASAKKTGAAKDPCRSPPSASRTS
jgi:hypothetical protein